MSFRQQLSTLEKRQRRPIDVFHVFTVAVYLVAIFVQQRPAQMLCDLYATYVIVAIAIIAVYRREWPTKQWTVVLFAALTIFSVATQTPQSV